MVLGDLKGRPEQSAGKKVSGGHFFSPWENPSLSGRSPEDCERKVKTGYSRVGHQPIPKVCMNNKIKRSTPSEHGIFPPAARTNIYRRLLFSSMDA